MPAPPIRLHNTLNQTVETFEPIAPGEIRMYACGLTPYDLAHAGHARAYVTIDVLVRVLRASGYRVTYVRNVTDVDDKILKRSQELGEEPVAFAARMTELCHGDLTTLGCATPDHEPRVSDHVTEILDLISTLIAKEAAYVVETDVGRDVYFAVRSHADYGKLSHRKIDDLLSGARVDVGELKRDPLDFALWKGCAETSWGWPSPWGKGRPGWHIECSAMAARYVGQHFDIHCGGMDLIFPHHENETAQSEAAWGAPFARYWVHNGFVTVDQEKMSKSLGNFVTIRDVLDRNDPEALRYFIMATHYRSPLAFDVDTRDDGRVVFQGVDEAERRVEYLYATRDALLEVAAAEPSHAGAPPNIVAVVRDAPERVLEALRQDLASPAALAEIARLAKVSNDLVTDIRKRSKDPAFQTTMRPLAAMAAESLSQCCNALGLLESTNADFLMRARERRLRLRKLDPAVIDQKVAERTEARQQKDFARSDALRAELTLLGVEVLDSSIGTAWRLVV